MMLSLTGVSSGYAMIRVLNEVSLQVPAGGTVALVGPNGAGKTTLLETIAGFVTLHAGRIQLEGSDLGHLRPDQRARLGIALVTERRNLFPELSAGENLRLGRCSAPAEHRWDRHAIEAATERVLSLFPKLKLIIDRPVRVMSGGEQQMVAVGRALMAEPRLLMLDEPSQGLAPKLVQAMYEAIPQIAENTTVVLVEQDLSLARSVATALHLINGGRIRALTAGEAADEQLLAREIFGPDNTGPLS